MIYRQSYDRARKGILELITPGSSVLDLGCGSGDLLALLEREKKVRGQGIEVDGKAVFDCVTKGLNVFHLNGMIHLICTF